MHRLQRSIQRLPLRIRLTLWVVGIAAVIQLAIGAVYFLYQRAAVQQFFDGHLERRAQAMIDGLQAWLPGGGQAGLLDERVLRAIGDSQASAGMFGSFTLSLYDERAGLIATTRQSPRADISADELRALAASQSSRIWVARDAEILRLDDAAHMARALARGFRARDGRAYVLVTAASDAYAQRMMALVTRSLLISFPTAVLVAGFSGWFISGLAVRPLEQVRRAASQLGPESLDRQVRMTVTSPETERLERELNAVRERLAAAFAAQERFMSNVSHELKTPIAVLLTEAQTLDTTGAPREVLGYVQSATEELRRLGAMVDSFLLLTRVREGRSITRSKRYLVNELVMESVSHCASMADQYGVRLEPRLTDEVEASLDGDPVLLRTMLDNLVRNAVRFSPQGQAIDVSADADAREVRLRVRDRGAGIPEQIIARIFDRFVQAADEQRRGRGHGLGLEIAQGIAELHGGIIRARNCPDGGCEFAITLPRADRPREAGPATMSTPASTGLPARA